MRYRAALLVDRIPPAHASQAVTSVILRQLKMFGFWEMLVYISIVLVGFFYIWKKGVLDWSMTSPRRGEV